MADTELEWIDATGTAELIRSGEVTASEVLEAAIARIEAANPALNAVIHPLFEQVRRELAAGGAPVPDGPFAGVPLVVKDLIAEIADEPFYEGMAYLKALDYRPPADQALVRMFRRAGFVIVGKTNTSELGGMPTTEPLCFGPTHNPWKSGHSPGGSSGGSAAAVASGMVPVGHANDAGGSIRIPASRCGLVGLKPSRGRVSQGPLYGDLFGGLIQELVVTRTVRDCAGVLDAVCGRVAGDPFPYAPPGDSFRAASTQPPGSLRVRVWDGVVDGAAPIDPEVAATVADAAAALAELGHHVEAGHPRLLEGRATLAVLGRTVYASTHWAVRRWERICGVPCPDDQLEPITRFYVEQGRRLSAADLLDLEESMQLFTRSIAEWFAAGVDLYVTPTCAETASRHGELQAETDADVTRALRAAVPTLSLTAWCNVTGMPAISLPLGWSADGLPIGVQIAAAHGREALLLQVARQLEDARPWAQRRPPRPTRRGSYGDPTPRPEGRAEFRRAAFPAGSGSSVAAP